MRECARKQKVNRKTVARKMLFLGLLAKQWIVEFRKTRAKINEVQFDEMETFEHTKCKPISIPLAVEKNTRLILSYEVAPMPAKGKLAAKALQKYGPRADLRKQARAEMFLNLKECVNPLALLESDMNPNYPREVKFHFPLARHETTKGRRGCIVGQGELKAIVFDPLFSLNHTCAMFRASVCRLIRKTWCTTKKIDRLDLHLAIYAKSHNVRILTKLAG